MRDEHYNRGFGFIEAVISAGIATIIITGMLAMFQSYVRAALHLPERVQASFLAEEGLEALRSIRDKEWEDFGELSGTGYLSFGESGWQATATPEYVEGMLRSFNVSNVSRGAGDDIVLSGGVNDPLTKKAEVTVAWQEGGATTTLSLATYFADIHAD